MRYFIVTYNYTNSDQSWGFGDVDIISKSYPRRNFIGSEIFSQNSEVEMFTISNIIELSQADYESYMS